MVLEVRGDVCEDDDKPNQPDHLSRRSGQGCVRRGDAEEVRVCSQARSVIVRTTRADRPAPKIAFVLAQLGPWPTSSPLRRAWDRARPPLRPSDFPCGDETTARRSLARAHSWLERGMLT